MAEDGIEDFGLAKRKAARQVGLSDTRQLPTNEEIEEALRLHRTLYEVNHDEHLASLRGCAVEIMDELASFNPRLTGSVLSGTAGPYADINLHLYTDDEKAVELRLIDTGRGYRTGQTRLYAGNEARLVPSFTFEEDGVQIELLVLPAIDVRVPVKTSIDGRPIERAKTSAVRGLLEAAG
jgi:hypothetical protein